MRHKIINKIIKFSMKQGLKVLDFLSKFGVSRHGVQAKPEGNTYDEQRHSDDSDLDSSSDEEPENAVLARTTPQTDSEDEEVSEAPSAGSIDNAFGEIPKPSKDSPTWKAVRSSSSNAMREWKDVPPYPSPVESPINYLRNCFDVTFLSHICEQSSLYSAQRNPNKVTSMTVNDLEQFIGTVLTMSLIKLPQTRMYWSQRFRVSQVADTMTRDRWEEIKQSLHFSDNQEAPDQNDPERDRLYKVRPLLDHLVAKCHEIPKSQKLCVDEQLVPFKGRSSLKQYLLNKAKKWGFLKKVGISSVGTVREARLKGGKLPSDKDLKKKGRGSYVEMATTFEGVSLRAVKWFNNRLVTLLSTFASASPEPAVKRFDKKTRTTVSVPRPAIIGIYNECMGGVDLLDMLVALYRIHVRSKKVYRRLFFHLLDVVVVNCWLLYLRDATAANVPCKHQMTLLTFKADIACALRQQGKVSTPSRK
nr:piggyBac transposable element-derived protein 4-like [Rhipicephalus microplus]